MSEQTLFCSDLLVGETWKIPCVDKISGLTVPSLVTMVIMVNYIVISNAMKP